jgi:hypothetical protein
MQGRPLLPDHRFHIKVQFSPFILQDPLLSNWRFCVSLLLVEGIGLHLSAVDKTHLKYVITLGLGGIMKKMTLIGLLLAMAGFISTSSADWVISGGSLTESNNWNKGVFDNTQNPAAGTSTGDASDLVAQNRTMALSQDYATFTKFSLGTDGGGGSNKTGGHLDMTGGFFIADNMFINPNNVKTGEYCSVTQSGGDMTINTDLTIGKLGEASYTVSGGSFAVSGSMYLGAAIEGHEHSFIIDGQDATSITVAGNFGAGAGTGDAYQNVRFNLGATGITPLEVTGSFWADAQNEFIVDGQNYTGGVGSITLATAGNNVASMSNSVTQTFLNFNEYIPELFFTNKAVTLNLTLNPHPELLLDKSFEGLTGSEPNSNSAPWFTTGENQVWSFQPTTDPALVRTGSKAVKFEYYFDSGAIVQNVDKMLESGESYEFAVWNLLTDPGGGAAQTNASEFTLSIWTSAVKDGTYSYRKGLFGNLATTTNEYQQFTYAFTTADIVDGGAGLGEYIQVRIAKANENSIHRLCFDDASLKTVESVDNSYASWSNQWGVAIGTEEEDYDNDGLINLYEYGLGGNPTNGFVNGRIPTFSKDGAVFEYVHARRTDDPTLMYYLETTESLLPASWTNDGYTVVGTNVTGGTFDYVTNSIPTIDDQSFIKLIIENY